MYGRPHNLLMHSDWLTPHWWGGSEAVAIDVAVAPGFIGFGAPIDTS